MTRVRAKRIIRGTWDKLNFGLPILYAKLRKRRVPFQVLFSLTNRCNLRCEYCFAEYPQRSHPDLSTEQVLQIVDELAELGTRRVNLAGGEPLVRRDIGQIIAHIKDDLRLECAMTTNGHFVGRNLEHVQKLDLLCVSIDGRREAHDRCRGEGSHARAVEALHLGLRHGIHMQMAAVLTRHNLNDIEYLLEMGKDLGCSVAISTLIGKTESPCRQRPDYLPTDDQTRTALRRILELKERGYPVLFSRKSLEHALHWRYSYARDRITGERPDFDHIHCHAGRCFCLVDVNGDLYPCPVLVGAVQTLNVLEHGARRAFAHAGGHSCQTCHIPCVNDFNLAYSLSPRVLFNIWRNYQPRSQRRMFGRSQRLPATVPEGA